MLDIFRRRGRILLIVDGEEQLLARTREPGTLRLHVDRVEPDAEWVLARVKATTHPAGSPVRATSSSA